MDEEDNENDSRRGSSRSRNNSRTSSSSRSSKRVATLTDQQSAGRKRAARMYPLDPAKPCDFRGSSNCGGGSNPITGCLSGKQEARHHGPDKNVSNNEAGNVHRICHYCHNRWHAANDPGYDWNATIYPGHDPRSMTDSEREAAMLDEMRYLGTTRRKTSVKD